MKRSRNMELKVHIDAKPHWSLDDTLQEVKSIVTLIENRIPQVPPLDVVIHFPDPEPVIETGGDDLPF